MLTLLTLGTYAAYYLTSKPILRLPLILLILILEHASVIRENNYIAQTSLIKFYWLSKQLNIIL